MGPDGRRVRDHLLMVSRMGVPVPELEISPFPEPASHLWRAFNLIQLGRQKAFQGSQPITYTEILSYATLMGDPLAHWEVHLIKVLDIIYLSAERESNGHSNPVSGGG